MIREPATLAHIAGDLQYLLAPIPEGPACGIDLREGPELRDLRMARGEDSPPRTSHRNSRWEPDWRRIAVTAEELLAKKSKDLRIACWLAEAWTHVDRLQGLLRGLVLICELVKIYGSQLHPHAADGAGAEELDLDEAAARLNWLDLVLPPRMPSLVRTDVDLASLAHGLEQAKLAKSALRDFESSLRRVSAPRMRQILDQLSERLESALTSAREREEWHERQKALRQREARMSLDKRKALLEREQIVRTLHDVLVFLAREEPDGLAPLLVERALRLFHKHASDVAYETEDEWRRLGRWSRDDPLPYPTVFDDPAAGDDG
jgi:predicted component of type VI protein secretion system